MSKEEAIKYLQQLYPNGGHCWLDEQRIEAIGMAVKALQEEPVSEDLEEAVEDYCKSTLVGSHYIKKNAFKAGAEWKFERVKEALLSEVLPCFMHGGEADEVVAKLDEVLNQK